MLLGIGTEILDSRVVKIENLINGGVFILLENGKRLTQKFVEDIYDTNPSTI